MMIQRKGTFPFSGLLFYLALFVTVLFIGAPQIWMFLGSFKPHHEIVQYPITLIPRHITLENYAGIFRTYLVGRWALNSAIVASITTFIVLGVQSLAGYAFAKMLFKLRNTLFLFIISMMIIPPEVYLIPLFLEMSKFHLLNTYFGLTVIQLCNPFSLFLFRQYFLTIPTEMEDAAMIDGCSRFGMFYRIILPNSKPVLVAVSIIVFMTTWNDFMWPLITVNRRSMKTLPIGMTEVVGLGTDLFDYGIMLAGAVVVTAPALVAFLVLQRYFIKSFVTTGLKG